MPLKLPTLSISLLLFFSAAAQTEELTGRWSNGFYSFLGGRLDDSTLLFEGADLHEGGYRFGLRVRAGGLFIAGGNLTHYPDDSIRPAIGKAGDKVTYRVVDGIKVLMLRSQGGDILDCFRTMKPNESLGKQVISSKIKYELSGKYRNKKTNKEVIFYPDRPVADGLTAASGYKFQTEYDFPLDVITFKNGKSFY